MSEHKNAAGGQAAEHTVRGDSATQHAVGCSVAEHSVGGQAVIEGVMMRGKRSWGLAVRQPSGVIARHSFALEPIGERYHVLKLPVLRGVVALADSLVLGMKALGHRGLSYRAPENP